MALFQSHGVLHGCATELMLVVPALATFPSSASSSPLSGRHTEEHFGRNGRLMYFRLDRSMFPDLELVLLFSSCHGHGRVLQRREAGSSAGVTCRLQATAFTPRWHPSLVGLWSSTPGANRWPCPNEAHLLQLQTLHKITVHQ
ncbi:hypothetical protein TRIUR3_18293 [Triticum urartu]|uniref:Uncharacterized protein n=1 Tax=Triticum urartu TaxID=4572 RepID=M7Y8H6_TRIUA|nr:hypothetical protein TRIUR3_18293 [Triticum urartu]